MHLNYKTVGDSLALICVAALWGITDPFIKKGSKGINNAKSPRRCLQPVLDLIYLFSNLQFIIPFLLNQCGSLLYYITITGADISLVVPLTNSLTFIFTILTGYLVGERITKGTIFGATLVSVGITLCVLGKP